MALALSANLGLDPNLSFELALALNGGVRAFLASTPPISKVVTRGKKARADHDSTFNYDDYNEFFWTPVCLMYVALSLSVCLFVVV